MKLKSLLFALCFSLFSSAFAAPQDLILDAKRAPNAATKAAAAACEIHVINYTDYDLRMWGEATNGAILRNTYIYDKGVTHIINLYDYQEGYCPRGMYLTIETVRGSPVYNRFTTTGTLIKVVPKQGMAMAEVVVK